MLIAINYHYIRERFDAPYPSIFGLNPREFSAQLDLLGQSAEFLGAEDIVDILEGRKPLPPRSVVITFDDGFREQYEIAWPILQEKGIPAIFFVNTKPIEDDFVTTTHKIHLIRAYTPPNMLITMLKDIMEMENISMAFPNEKIAQSIKIYDTPENAQIKYFLNCVLTEQEQHLVIDRCFSILGFDEPQVNKDLYMTKDMIKDLAQNGALGTHGHAHRPLGLLDEKEALTDFKLSIKKIKKWTGYTISSLSFPFGFREACSEKVASYAQKCDVKFAFTMERAGNCVIDAPMFMGRFNDNDVPGGKHYGNTPTHFWSELKHATWFR